jgi:hypothetical protein
MPSPDRLDQGGDRTLSVLVDEMRWNTLNCVENIGSQFHSLRQYICKKLFSTSFVGAQIGVNGRIFLANLWTASCAQNPEKFALRLFFSKSLEYTDLVRNIKIENFQSLR